MTERLRVQQGVAEYDLADLGVDNVNKFIAYAADPSTLYTVAVTCNSLVAASASRIADLSQPTFSMMDFSMKTLS